MNTSPSNDIWAKLIALSPDKEDIPLINNQPEELDDKPNIEWKIYQKSTGETYLINLSASSIKIDDSWLEVDKEKKMFGGEKVSFNKEKESKDQSFDYVFCLVNPQPKNELKRNREDNLEPSTLIPPHEESQKMVKMSSDLQQELTCTICTGIFHKCATLNPCQHTFCSSCVLDFLKNSIHCPLCRVEAVSITKNLAIQNLVELTLKNFPDLQRPKEKFENLKNELTGTVTKTGREVFIGSCKKGKKEGKGHLICANGDIYEGHWKNNKREGRGVMIDPNGDIYKGQWRNDVLHNVDEIVIHTQGVYKGETKGYLLHGKGVLTFDNGDIYDGNFADDTFDGFGKYIYKEKGGEYEGEWKEGKKHGFGVVKYTDGRVYKGEWRSDKREGEGVLELKSGCKYEGNFKNDLFNGLGKYTWTNGDEYEGNYVDGHKTGFGTQRLANGHVVYTGNWKDDEKDGDGIYFYEAGERYEGSWMKDVFHGKGTYTWNDGREYEGDWADDNRHGIGKMRYADGKIYEGKWKDNKKEGDGVLTLPDGVKYEGSWVYDVLQSVRKICYANGDVYEGEVQMENLIKQGKGVLTYKNGDKYEGFWENDKQQGNGKEVCRDGKRIYEGVWKEGKMSGEVIMTDADGIRYKAEWKKLNEGEQMENKPSSLGENKRIDAQENEQNKE